MESQKEMISLEIDQFFADQGLTDTNIAKLSSDPNLKAIASNLQEFMAKQRDISNKQVVCYEEMRDLIENQVEKHTASSMNPDFGSPVVTTPGPTLRSSMRKLNGSNMTISSLNTAKSVKIATIEKEENQSTSRPPVSEKPLTGLKALNLSIPLGGFNENQPPSVNNGVVKGVNNTSSPSAVTR